MLVAMILEQGAFLRSCWQSFKKAIPYFAVVFVYGILRLTVLNFANTLNFYNAENIYSSHLSVRVYTFFHALLVYYRLIFVPTGLHMERGVDIHTSLFQWPVWASILILMGLIGFGARSLF